MIATNVTMLTTLRIKNLALVTDLALDLSPGCNVITGETGAGKSILIGALNLVLGERADRTLIRDGCDSCLVEAVFSLGGLRHPINAFLEQHGLELCEEDRLVLKRSFTTAGANRQFINGSPATLASLAAVGEWLVDIHGPHEHQSLLHPAKQRLLLDAFGRLQPEREAFADLVRRRAALQEEKAALIVDERTYAQQVDLLRFQVAEIAAARLEPGEDARIDQEYRRASNAAKLLQLGQSALDAIDGGDGSLTSQAGAAGRALRELQRIDPAAEPLVVLHEQTAAAARELQSELSRYLDRVEVDPARLKELEERLDLLQSLKRKYGPQLADVLVFGEEARHKLDLLERREAELERINLELAKVGARIAAAGRELSAKRRKAIPRLARAALKELSDLGFAQCRFDIELRSADPESGGAGELPADGKVGLHGLDEVEFQFAPNPGEAARPLRAIASSGELARVMLALKTVLAAEDEVPVLVFDEVDANVGGETANAVGAKMVQIAARRQVLCITHLPQVAAAAQAHYVVSKQVRNGRTVSEIQQLEGGERVAELSRMLGGGSEAAIRHAESLLAGGKRRQPRTPQGAVSPPG